MPLQERTHGCVLYLGARNLGGRASIEKTISGDIGRNIQVNHGLAADEYENDMPSFPKLDNLF